MRIKPSDYISILTALDPNATIHHIFGKKLWFRTGIVDDHNNYVSVKLPSSYYFWDPCYFFIYAKNTGQIYLFHKNEIDKCGGNKYSHFYKKELVNKHNEIKVYDESVRYNKKTYRIKKSLKKKDIWRKEVKEEKTSLSYSWWLRKNKRCFSNVLSKKNKNSLVLLGHTQSSKKVSGFLQKVSRLNLDNLTNEQLNMLYPGYDEWRIAVGDY